MSDFLLIETMRWEPGTGIIRLPLHMARLKKSARELGFAGANKAEEKLAEALAESLPPSALSGISPSRGESAGGDSSAKACPGLISPLEGRAIAYGTKPPLACRPSPPQGGRDPAALSRFKAVNTERRVKPLPLVGRGWGGVRSMGDRPALEGEMPDRAEGGNATPTSALRIRLTLSLSGEIAVTTAPHSAPPENTVWRIAIASTRLTSKNILLRHKTSRRELYETARREYAAAEADEVLLFNENDEPCEGTITSLFLDDGSGILKTPPISNGLLAGVLRTELICQRRARVERLSREDVGTGTLYMGNSLRGLIRAQFMKED